MRTGNHPAGENPNPGRKPRNSGFAAWSVTAFHPLFVEALQKQDHVEYLLDVLLSPDMEERAVLIVDYGKEVSNLERRMAELAAQDTAGRRTDHTRSSPAPEH